MTRAQRRKADQQQRREAKRFVQWPDDVIPVHHSASDGKIKDGDKFTIAGLRRTGPSSFDQHCKPGEETVFIARVLLDH